MVDYNTVSQDIILWDCDNVDVFNTFNSLPNHLLHIKEEPKRENFNINVEIDVLRKFYSLDQSYNFNKFWVDHINRRQKAPFFMCAFDDFDIMQMPEF